MTHRRALAATVPLWKIALAATPAILFAFVAGLIIGLRVVCP